MNKLKELRESLSYSVEEFAKKMKIHRSSLYRYEGTNKKEPRDLPMEVAIDISEKFNISLDWLVGKEVPKYRDNIINIIVGVYEKLSELKRQELLNYAIFLQNQEELK